jgi:hypothetical protein
MSEDANVYSLHHFRNAEGRGPAALPRASRRGGRTTGSPECPDRTGGESNADNDPPSGGPDLPPAA